MTSDAFQIGQVINKLLEKTKTNKDIWRPSLVPRRYQARFGPYVVEISGPSGATSLLGNYATIKVTKLDGTTVVEATGSPVSAATFGTIEQLDHPSSQSLNELYSIVGDRSEDLDALIRLI